MSKGSKTGEARRIKGIALSDGIVIGTAYRVEPRTPSFYRIRIKSDELAAEIERFRAALQSSKAQLRKIKERLQKQVGGEHAFIIDAHLLMLEDRSFIEAIEREIQEEQASAERAVREVSESWLQVYQSLEDPFFRERGSELEEVTARVLANLIQLDSGRRDDLPDNLILVASDISLSVLADYGLERIRGLVLTRGGATSHVNIIARSCQIPVVAGIEDVEKQIRTGDQLVVDGFEGLVSVFPSQEEVRHYRSRINEEKQRALKLQSDESPSITMDGRRIVLYGNTEVGSEVAAGLKFGVEGIGLFRSEYIYMKHKRGPISEEEQFLIYRELASSVGDRPAVIRTLDIGDEKHPYFSALSGEAKAVLGLRGIRLSLLHPEIFRTQVRAILRATQYGNLKIVLPMVSSVDEVIESRRMIAQAQQQLAREGVVLRSQPEVGVMLEVPAAIFCLESLCEHSDFLAVGTNDLIQYTLAVGRANERADYLFNPWHPAILRSLRRIVTVAEKANRKAVVCGENATNPAYAYLLVGMGFRFLSMNPYSVPSIKNLIRHVNFEEASNKVDELLSLETLEQIEQFVDSKFPGWNSISHSEMQMAGEN